MAPQIFNKDKRETKVYPPTNNTESHLAAILDTLKDVKALLYAMVIHLEVLNTKPREGPASVPATSADPVQKKETKLPPPAPNRTRR